MEIVIVIMIIAIVIGLIISPSFRNGAVNLVTDIVTIAFGVSRFYAIVFAAALISNIVAVAFALFIQVPIFSGLVFLWICVNFFIVWLPLGVVLKIFKVNSAVVPASVRSFFAWLAFVAFLAVMAPELFTLKTVVVASILAVFFLALPTKVKFLEKVLMPFVVVMLLVAGWQHFFPEDFRSSVRYAQSWSKRINSSKDRGSIGNETEAATSYAQILKDVNALYLKSSIVPQLIMNPDTSKHLQRGDIVRLVSHKNEVIISDGQGFIEIQLKNPQGTYFRGPKYWIEAEFVQIASPRDIVPEDKSLLPANAQKTLVEILPEKRQDIEEDIMYLTPGVYNFFMATNEMSKKFHIMTNSFCINTDHNDQAKLYYSNGASLNLWQLSKLPNNNELQIKSLITQMVTIKVF